MKASQFALIALFALTSLGCGARAYEARLEETNKYFKFLEKQNVNLTKEWKNAGVSLRVPEHFTEIRRPPVKKEKDGTIIPEPDPRQPAFIEGGLPGIIGAWTTKYQVDGGEAPGYFYILSNHDLWLDESTAGDAPNFDTNAVNSVVGGLRVGLPADSQWKTENYPNSATAYNVQRAFSAASVAPEIDGRKYEATLYRVKNKDMQVILINLTPEGARTEPRAAPKVSNSDRLALALETFSMSGGKPTRTKPTGSGAGPKF